MASSTTEPLDDIGLFFLSTGTDEAAGIRSYSISVEKAEDSHYVFSAEAMDTLDAYLDARSSYARLHGYRDSSMFDSD
jgi:hypothetical protein